MLIRPMELQDMERVTTLCAQWGYPVRMEQVRAQFQQIGQLPDNQLFVAVSEEKVCGWVHAQGLFSLGSDPYVEIKGIVVDEKYRKQGVGRQLMQAAEKWALEKGYALIRLRSGVNRPEAHSFYPSIGYDHTKSQHVYQKKLFAVPK